MEELGTIPPSSHSWTAPLVEDMLCKARTGLTKAVVTGPGRAVLFSRRHSMGKGLMADEARDAAFLLTWAGMWVGKLAYLTADPVTIQEGRRAIAQAVSENRVKARGPRCPHVNLPAQQPFWFNVLKIPLQKTCQEKAALTTSHHLTGPIEAVNAIEDRETRDLNCLGFLCLPQTMALGVIGVCYWRCLQCHPDLTVQTDQGIPVEVEVTEKKHAWR